MKKPRRHHYLPVFYLNGFCRANDLLWVFDRNKKQFRQQSPKNTAIISNYYSFEDKKGEKCTEIETMFSVMEGKAKIVIDKLIARDSITATDREDLSFFVGFLMNRVPDFEKSINDVQEKMIRQFADFIFANEESAQRGIDLWERDTGNKYPKSAKELVAFNKSGDFDIVIHRNQSLKMMLSMSVELANYFKQMDWTVAHAPAESSFITTDNPVLLIAPDNYQPDFYGVGILTPGAKKVFPLSQSSFLLIRDKGTNVTHTDPDKVGVRGANLIVANQADRFVIGRDEPLVKSLVSRTKLAERKREGRFGFSSL